MGGLIVGDCEILNGRRKLGHLHVDPGQFIALVLVGDAPLAGFLVDDEGPLVGSWEDKQCVAASRHVLSANYDVAARDESCGRVGSVTPDLAVRILTADHLTSFQAWAGVVGLNRLAAAEITGGRSRRASLCRGEQGECQNREHEKGNPFLHGLSVRRVNRQGVVNESFIR